MPPGKRKAGSDWQGQGTPQKAGKQSMASMVSPLAKRQADDTPFIMSILKLFDEEVKTPNIQVLDILDREFNEKAKRLELCDWVDIASPQLTTSRTSRTSHRVRRWCGPGCCRGTRTLATVGRCLINGAGKDGGDEAQYREAE